MAVGLDVRIKKGKHLDRQIRKAARRLQNRWEPHVKAGVYMEKQIRIAYNRQRTLGGGTWDDLEDITKDTRRFPGKPPLVQTGALRRSIRYTVHGASGVAFGPAISVTRISPEKAGSSRRSVKARVHQAGSVKSRIPARPYLGLSKTNRDKIQEIFAKWVENQLKKEGF